MTDLPFIFALCAGSGGALAALYQRRRRCQSWRAFR